MSLRTRFNHVPLLFFTLIVLVFGAVWSTLAQDGLVPLPGSMESSGRAFTEVQQLTASDGASGDYFGRRVSVDGNVLLTGSEHAAPGGAAYIFERGWGLFAEVTRLVGSDTTSGDEFGLSIALDGTTAVVGAPSHTATNTGDGAVYIFIRDTSGIWFQWQKLTITGAADYSGFGIAVDIDGDRLVSADKTTGKAHIFKRGDDQVWQLEDTLVIGSNISVVKIEGDTVLLGALYEDAFKGAAYLYQLNAGSWTPVQRLTANDGQANDMFGSRLALKDGQAFVRARLGNATDQYTGAVYVYSENGGTWIQTQKLTPDDPDANDPYDDFGWDLAVDGGTLVISGDRTSSSTGAVYRFGWNGSAWVQQSKIVGVGGQFGYSVDLQAGVMVSGAPSADSDKGRIYVYSDPALLVTPTYTPTITPTPVITDTPQPAVELLINGGFENNATGWTVKNATGDKVKCNKPTKTFAYSGNCAWRFKGGPGENAKIQQIITSGVTSGDVLKLGGYVNAGGAVSGKLKLVVTYADGVTPKGKLTINLTSPTSGYVPLSSLQPALTVNVAAPVEKIKLMVKNSSTSGKVYIDTLSLSAQ